MEDNPSNSKRKTNKINSKWITTKTNQSGREPEKIIMEDDTKSKPSSILICFVFKLIEHLL